MAVAVQTSAVPPLSDRSSAAVEGVRLDAPQASFPRGPLRPEALSPVRSRLTGAMAQKSFRALDGGVLATALGLTAALHPHLSLLAPCALGALAAFVLPPAFGAYVYSPDERAAQTLARVALVFLIAGILAAGVARLVAPQAPVGTWTLASWSMVSLTHLGQLQAVRGWRRQGRLTPNILVVGATDNARRLVETALRTREVAVLGVFDDRSDRIAPTVHGVPVLGDTTALLAHRILPYVDRIVLTVNAAGPARTAELIERLRVLPNELCLFLDGEDPKSRSTTLSWLARSTLNVGGAEARESRQMAKRMQDIVLGLLLLIPASPVMALVALAVRLDSPGPILFRQRRHGFNNEEILVWKFRSMKSDATDQDGARQVSANDDRVTRVGRFIRKTSLDELPQVFNVLKGCMSLVGPRPHPVRHEDRRSGQCAAGRRVRLAPPHEARHHRLGADQRLTRSGQHRGGGPPAGGARRRLHRAPVLLARPLYPGHDPAAPAGRRRGGALSRGRDPGSCSGGACSAICR